MLLRRCTVCLTFVFALPAMADDLQLPDLMRTLSHNQQQEATFVEKRYLSVLDKPLESSGELYFIPPNRLEKRTLKPKPETLIVDGDVLIVDQSNRHRFTVSLQERPDISAFVESIRGTLAGDQSALEKFYSIELSGSADRWRLSLVPLRQEMMRIISRIQIAGSQADLTTIEFDFADGDRSEMLVAKARSR
ncbi:MAG TPA: outer membrane lipoprotein carrier protein LolA [Burkholderiaceae bacterium]|nr:outer membrane lipoprotein carrier protein LolA [Burkholderiaceae bacterium]